MIKISRKKLDLNLGTKPVQLTLTNQVKIRMDYTKFLKTYIKYKLYFK